MPRPKGAKNKISWEWMKIEGKWVKVKNMWVKEVKLAELLFRPDLVKVGFYNDDA